MNVAATHLTESAEHLRQTADQLEAKQTLFLDGLAADSPYRVDHERLLQRAAMMRATALDCEHWAGLFALEDEDTVALANAVGILS